MRGTNIKIFSFIMFLWLIPCIDFAQKVSDKDINIKIGATLGLQSYNGDNAGYPQYSSVDEFIEKAPLSSVDIALSYKSKYHEFYVGSLVNEKTIGIKYKPSIGGIFGYNYFVDKNPHSIQFYLNYSLIFQRYIYDKTIEFPVYPNIIENWTYKRQYYNNVFGYGINFYLTKNKNIYFYQTTGIALTYYNEKSILNNVKQDNDVYFNAPRIMFTAGMTYKLTSIKNKTKTE